MFNYDPLRKTLKEKGITQEKLIKENVINRQNATSIKHNKPMRTDTLDKICQYLNCDFQNIIKHIDDNDMLM